LKPPNILESPRHDRNQKAITREQPNGTRSKNGKGGGGRGVLGQAKWFMRLDPGKGGWGKKETVSVARPVRRGKRNNIRRSLAEAETKIDSRGKKCQGKDRDTFGRKGTRERTSSDDPENSRKKKGGPKNHRKGGKNGRQKENRPGLPQSRPVWGMVKKKKKRQIYQVVTKTFSRNRQKKLRRRQPNQQRGRHTGSKTAGGGKTKGGGKRGTDTGPALSVGGG